jgi:hypothetical protein
VFDRACSMPPDTPDCLGWAGVVKARLGQRDQALALREAIYRTDSTPRRRIGQQAYHQARISAAVGDREGAVEFLRRAFVHGFSHSAEDHRVFHDLLNYPPFKELSSRRIRGASVRPFPYCDLPLRYSGEHLRGVTCPAPISTFSAGPSTSWSSGP